MSDDFTQFVKGQADIVRIIGDYLKLRKSGAQNYTGLCPFHKEKTGSFSVNATHGYFYCFGCHEKGDVFTFVMKMENISFPEAIRVVATKCGIPLPKREFSSPQAAHEAGLRRQLVDIHEAATQYFEAALKGPEAARAREYLTGRGVTPETVAKFRIGYAPDDFNHMREQLAKHFPDEVLRASGLFSSKEQADGGQGQLYARFRKRITFPIANEQGKTIADTAGIAATEKSIALLTEEDFEVKIVTLEGGLDPDRFLREQGVQSYMAALRNAKRHSDFLIDHAREQFPGRTADAKVKALNFLLPHIRRMPNRIQRDEFAADAAQKLGIDSAILRQELKQAAAQRVESVRAHNHDPASETERVLLRALVLPEHDPARILAADQLSHYPEWYDSLPAAALLEALSNAPAPPNPLDAAPDQHSHVLLARTLQHADDPTASSSSQSMTEQVENALHTLAHRQLERRQRELRTLIAEADRRGDQEMLRKLTAEKLQIDRKLREHCSSLTLAPPD